MLIRRAFLRWLVAAAVVLPIWLGIGWAIFGGGGWGTLGLVIVVPVAFIALAIVALLVWIRPTVRARRASSWTDVAVVGAWHASIVGVGFYGEGGAFFGVIAILLAVAAFWSAVWQLVRDGARRVQATMSEFERLAAQQTGQSQGPDAAGRPRGQRPPFGDDEGDVIIVREVRD
ncbi:hypothetical protein ACFWN7_02085 [Agromyces sp. NPDC058484]|uniref:hypothetical protein n=1 Tax=Agromyces sp. NPDC058484 TaxID=3346524 RepID=UPI00364FE3D9